MTLRTLGFAFIAVLAGVSTAAAKDQVAGQSGARASAESCCVEVTMLPPIETSPALDRQALSGHQVSPVSKAEPGLDGADWSCRRPDVSQRCVSELLTNH